MVAKDTKLLLSFPNNHGQPRPLNVNKRISTRSVVLNTSEDLKSLPETVRKNTLSNKNNKRKRKTIQISDTRENMNLKKIKELEQVRKSYFDILGEQCWVF